MASVRHKQTAARRAATAPWRRRLVSVALPAAGLLTLTGVATAAVVHDADVTTASAGADVSQDQDIITEALEEEPTVSRGVEREPVPEVEPSKVKVTGRLVALHDGVTIHADASRTSPVLARLGQGDEVAVTGKRSKGWTQVVLKELPRWVRTKDVAKELPLGTEPCPGGSGVESGLQPDTIKVHRAVCARFPQISSYGGTAGRGEHATGHSLDIMISSDLGNEIAAFLQEHRAELGIEYLIWRQRIWRPATSNSWRPMSDRGSPTANHMDHVHVTVVGSSASYGG